MKTMIARIDAPRTVGLPVLAWLRVARERRQLAALGPDELADLGIAPEAARMEAARPFWDLPRRG